MPSMAACALACGAIAHATAIRAVPLPPAGCWGSSSPTAPNRRCVALKALSAGHCLHRLRGLEWTGVSWGAGALVQAGAGRVAHQGRPCTAREGAYALVNGHEWHWVSCRSRGWASAAALIVLAAWLHLVTALWTSDAAMADAIAATRCRGGGGHNAGGAAAAPNGAQAAADTAPPPLPTEEPPPLPGSRPGSGQGGAKSIKAKRSIANVQIRPKWVTAVAAAAAAYCLPCCTARKAKLAASRPSAPTC